MPAGINSASQHDSSAEGNITTNTMTMDCGAVVSGAPIINAGRNYTVECTRLQESAQQPKV